MGALLVVALVFQFRAKTYEPIVYWLVVVLLSIVGTLITDNLVENFGVPLEVTTVLFAVCLAVAFGAWHAKEKTLSIHSIFTPRREGFYWAAILFTFALGTAGGDVVSERFDLGYLTSAFIFGGLIAVVAAAHLRFHLNAVFAFWTAYILTRPLGDYFSQPRDERGLGLGTVATSGVFLLAIVGLVAYLVRSQADAPSPEAV